MYMLTERLLSFNWQRFTLHKNEKRNTEFYELIELPSYLCKKTKQKTKQKKMDLRQLKIY